jgi:hypothetical protein
MPRPTPPPRITHRGQCRKQIHRHSLTTTDPDPGRAAITEIGEDTQADTTIAPVIGVGTAMITSGVASAPLLPHHQRVIPQTRRTPRLCRSPVERPDFVLIKDRSGTPTDGYGQYVRQHFLEHAGTTPALDLVVYADALGSDWANWSWDTTVNFSSPAPVSSGNASISVTSDTA